MLQVLMITGIVSMSAVQNTEIWLCSTFYSFQANC